MTDFITATFKTRPAAESALRDLEAVGVTADQVSLVVTDETRGKHFAIEEDSKIDEGVAAGAATGGIIGAVLGTLATATALAIPGLNLVISGPVIASLAGLGAGAATGGIIGGLVGAGIPEHEAKIYENEIRKGAVLLAVKPRDAEQKKRIKAVLERGEACNLAA